MNIHCDVKHDKSNIYDKKKENLVYKIYKQIHNFLLIILLIHS